MPETGVELTNTPGVYYVLAYFLSSCLYIGLNPRRFKGVKLFGVQLFFLIVLWLCIYVCCDMSRKNAAYFCIRAFILGEFAASLEWQMYYYGLTKMHLEPDPVRELLFLLLSHILVFGVMCFLEKRYAARNGSFQVTGMLFACHMQLQELNMRVEKEFLQHILHMQYKNDKISEESIALVNQKFHGFGMKSIQRIAEKYNGSVTIDTKDGWFELRILIPL